MPNIDTTAPAMDRPTKVFGMDADGQVGWLPAGVVSLADLYPIAPMGGPGAGLGVCPTEILPEGMEPLPGYTDRLHRHFGNYQYADGSIMCWVPKFFYRINHADNPAHEACAPNDIHVVGTETFANRAQAAAAGYVLHRAFIDGGVEQAGFFVDKYKSSKNAQGAGWIASSIKGGLPLSAHADHNPISALTATPNAAYYAFVDAPKARDGVDGAVNPGSAFHCMSIFQQAALAMLSLAHGQAATGATHCAWYDAAGLTNYPKGCNNNALRDTDDATVLYESDGYENCGKTGSGVPFARTTHNGQESGVADINGLMNEVLIGVTCIGGTASVTGATKADPCALTVAAHGLETGRVVRLDGVAGMEELNGRIFTITVVDPDTITLDGVDSTGFAAWVSGGTISFGQFYAAKEATRAAEFTSGDSAATDHWGAAGVAAMMEPLDVPMFAPPGGSPYILRFGNDANQVLDGASSGNGYALTGAGFPMSTDAASPGGADMFGKDQFFRGFTNTLCVIGCGSWSYGSGAGAFLRHIVYNRTSAYNSVGGRAACYPV